MSTGNKPPRRRSQLRRQILGLYVTIAGLALLGLMQTVLWVRTLGYVKQRQTLAIAEATCYGLLYALVPAQSGHYTDAGPTCTLELQDGTQIAFAWNDGHWVAVRRL